MDFSGSLPVSSDSLLGLVEAQENIIKQGPSGKKIVSFLHVSDIYFYKAKLNQADIIT